MVGEAVAGLGALKAAFDLARGLKEIDDATRRSSTFKKRYFPRTTYNRRSFNG